MNKEMKMMLSGLMEAGNDDLLQQMYDGYVRELPIELIHIEDREICDFISDYFKAKQDILNQLDEQIEGHEGMCEFTINSDIFTAVILCYVKYEKECGCGVTPDIESYSYSELKINITVTPE